MKQFHRGAFLFAILIGASGAIGSEQTAPPAQAQRFPQFENEDVMVWRSVIQANAPLAMHRHEHPRVIIALNGGTIDIVENDGTSAAHVWETGKAYWLPANAPNTMHADVNKGAKPVEVMVVELKHEK
jgi:quercetin dioxygenase-like cupin family protein